VKYLCTDINTAYQCWSL